MAEQRLGGRRRERQRRTDTARPRNRPKESEDEGRKQAEQEEGEEGLHGSAAAPCSWAAQTRCLFCVLGELFSPLAEVFFVFCPM